MGMVTAKSSRDVHADDPAITQRGGPEAGRVP